MRLAEHPLLNKSLFAVSNVIDQLVKCSDTSQQQQSLAMLSAVPYAASTLTLLLQEVLGGNCLTLALLSMVPGDFAGSKTTLQLGRALADVRNFPLVNNAMVQGQRWRHIARLTTLRDDKPLANSDNLMRERKALKLERDLVHAAFENRTLTEDRDKLAGLVAELKEKYRLLFDNELELRKELLASEQDKLALSKAFVQFQLDKAEQVQALDSAKFELETKLAQAEQLVLDIQQGDNTKAEQLQELCVKLSEVVRDKTKLAEDLELLQLHTRDQMQALDKESKKNQQLSLELIVAVNQKLKMQSERENIEAANRDIIARAQDFERDLERARSEARETEVKLAKSVSQIEEMRVDLVRKELELERLALSAKQEQLQRDKADSEATRDRSARSDQLAGQLDVERAAFAGEKRMLSLQLERALVEGKQLAKEKEELITAWMAKSRDTEELAAQNDRLRAEMQAQVEVFRAKLTRVQDATASSQTTAPGTGPSVSALALSELMLSYQSREKQLRDQLERSEADRIVLLQRRYDQQPEVIRQQEAVTLGRQAGPQEQRESKAFEEVRSFREQRAIAEQQLALEREQRSAQTLAAISLERHNQELARECQAWEAKYRELEHAMQNTARQSRGHRPPDADAVAITQMHATLLQQIDEIRRLTLATQQQQQQQQQQQDKSNQVTHEPSLPVAASSRDQVAILRSENKQLAAKLAASKDQWGKVVEEAERRCAALLTKNVMLAEENQHLQQHVKVRSPNNSLLDWWLRLCFMIQPSA